MQAYSTGCPSSSGSYSVLVLWSGGVSWVLLRPTAEIFALPPRAPEVAVYSDHRNRGYSLFLFLVGLPPQPMPVHSRWLAPLCGMGFLCRNDCFPWMNKLITVINNYTNTRKIPVYSLP